MADLFSSPSAVRPHPFSNLNPSRLCLPWRASHPSLAAVSPRIPLSLLRSAVSSPSSPPPFSFLALHLLRGSAPPVGYRASSGLACASPAGPPPLAAVATSSTSPASSPMDPRGDGAVLGAGPLRPDQRAGGTDGGGEGSGGDGTVDGGGGGVPSAGGGTLGAADGGDGGAIGGGWHTRTSSSTSCCSTGVCCSRGRGRGVFH